MYVAFSINVVKILQKFANSCQICYNTNVELICSRKTKIRKGDKIMSSFEQDTINLREALHMTMDFSQSFRVWKVPELELKKLPQEHFYLKGDLAAFEK